MKRSNSSNNLISRKIKNNNFYKISNDDFNIKIKNNNKKNLLIKNCDICYNYTNINNWYIYNCGHQICLYCYEKMINNELFNCPFCREPTSEYSDKIQTNSNYEENFRKNIYLMIYLFLSTLLLYSLVFFCKRNNLYLNTSKYNYSQSEIYKNIY